MGDVFDQAAQSDTPTDVFDAASKTPSGGIGQTNKTGFWGALGHDLAGMVTGLGAGNGNTGPDYSGRVGAAVKLNDQQNAQQAVEDKARKAAGYSDTYTALAPVAEGIGVNVSGMEDAAKQGDTGAVLGHAAAVPTVMAATEGLARGVPAGAKGLANAPGVRQIRELYKPLADVKTGTVDTRQGQFSPLPGPKNPATVQPVVQQGIRDVAGSVAKEAGVAPSKATSIRDVVGETAENIRAKSQPTFQKLDELSKGQFSDAQAAAKRYRGAIDKAGKDAYAEAVAKQDKIFETFKDQFEPEAFIKAKADWRQYRALQDVDEAIKSNTIGQRPDIAKKTANAQPTENIKATQLSTHLHRLYNDGTLETALGKQAADDLLTHVGSAEKQVELINQHNKEFIASNRASNTRIREKNEASNAATVAKNQAANDAILKKRTMVSRAVLGGGGAALGYYVKDKLSGQ